jgi:hypothetical protein
MVAVIVIPRTDARSSYRRHPPFKHGFPTVYLPFLTVFSVFLRRRLDDKMMYLKITGES